MVTASHNPKEYNGYKVYWGNGCQIIPPHDAGIAAAILDSLHPSSLAGSSTQGAPLDRAAWQQAVAAVTSHPLVSNPMVKVSEEYWHRLETLRFRSAGENAAAAAAVYTAMHGVGASYVLRAFQVMGLPPPVMVAEQEAPDPEFPTVAFPNPEEGKGAWRLAVETGEASGARLLLANDPDADRLAVSERCAESPGGWRMFTGNEIGILLADWLWTCTRTRVHTPASNANADAQRSTLAQHAAKYSVLSSAVSSQMLAAYACAEGLTWCETLTGFKWLGNRAKELEAEGHTVLFAFEEAIGFMLGPMFRDKDGVAAAAVMAELAAAEYAAGSTLVDRLERLQQRYGYYVTRASYFVADQPSKSRAVFDRLTAGGQYPQSVGGIAVHSVRDIGAGRDTGALDGTVSLPWQKGDMMLTLRLDGAATLTLRASGTEPKLKYYLEVNGSDRAASEALADRLVDAVSNEIICWQESGLSLPTTS
uniref:phosphoglucomutase (alpha-D-glucose-1,6-bisphosphate-dependent) n=1 Tax=Chlamydomonas euryale TaxID=1486919 RepID=A0A6U2BWI2_9CHLO|mmetsp:Transcript_11095/g.32994  ORF Transcript_11095/g.32994 Transcript_11095/m.32994 type:complete len:478 (+) Transcript_11095:219-1652(+)